MDHLFETEKGDRRSSLPPEVSTINLLLYTIILNHYHQIEEGNVEYKLKLLNPTSSRFEHLVTQMKWRLQEGRGEAIYEIGVADCGFLKGLADSELSMSLDTVKRMALRYLPCLYGCHSNYY